MSKNNQLNILQTVVRFFHSKIAEKRKNGQAARLISTSKLNASLRFHTWPINLVVYQEPSEGSSPWEISSRGGFHA